MKVTVVVDTDSETKPCESRRPMHGGKSKPKRNQQTERAMVRFTPADARLVDSMAKQFGYRKRATFVHDLAVAIERAIAGERISAETVNEWLESIEASQK